MASIATRRHAWTVGAALLLLPRLAAAEIACVGDCDSGGVVTINELITGVNIALGAQALGFCPFFDANGDAKVTINELIAGVNNALAACPVPDTPTVSPTGMASATATMTGTPVGSVTASATTTAPATGTASATATASGTATASTAATSTVTPGGTTVQEAVAGAAAAAANAMTVIPSIITAIAAGFEYGGASAALGPPWSAGDVIGGAGGACPQGGTATTSGSIPGTMTINLAACRLAVSGGFVVLDGSVLLSGLFTIDATVDVQANFTDAAGGQTLLTAADLHAVVTPSLGGSCYVTSADLTIDQGTVSSTIPEGEGVVLAFRGTQVHAGPMTFNADCVPVLFVLTFDGPATLTVTSPALSLAADTSIDLEYDDFSVSQDLRVSPAQTALAGTIIADCFGGAIELETVTPLQQQVGELCPESGKLLVSTAGGDSWILYPDGGVEIDVDRDGVSDETYDSCLDSELLRCVAVPTPTGSPAATGTSTATPTRTSAATVTSTATRTSTPPTPVPTATATRTGTATATPPVSPTATATSTRTATGAATWTRTATATLPPPATATATSTRTATSAMTPTPTRTATRTSTPSVTRTPTNQLHRYDRILEPPLQIYDYDPYRVFDDLHLTDTAVIDELAVYLDIRHTWVGDLAVTLTHWNTGHEVLLLYPPLECAGDNVLALLNDDAAVRCDNLCSDQPAIGDECSPTQPLSSFAGESLAGTWSVGVADFQIEDTGALAAWSLGALVSPPPTPGGLSAPEVLDLTCRGQSGDPDVHLWLEFGEPFTLTFTFADANGNADGWIIWAVDQVDRDQFLIDEGQIDPPSGGGTIGRYHPDGFTCTGPAPCPPTREFYIYVVITDSSGRQSAPALVDVVAYAPYLVTGDNPGPLAPASLDR